MSNPHSWKTIGPQIESMQAELSQLRQLCREMYGLLVKHEKSIGTYQGRIEEGNCLIEKYQKVMGS